MQLDPPEAESGDTGDLAGDVLKGGVEGGEAQKFLVLLAAVLDKVVDGDHLGGAGGGGADQVFSGADGGAALEEGFGGAGVGHRDMVEVADGADGLLGDLWGEDVGVGVGDDKI